MSSKLPFYVKPYFFLALVFFSFIAFSNPPANFTEAKIVAKEKIYFDKKGGTIYCGCDYDWHNKSGGSINLNSCGYKIRKQEKRAKVLEWEHIVPAHNFGHFLQCWSKGGGRKNCKTNKIYNQMEGDLFNLAPAIGEVNSDRSNFNFGILTGAGNESYGQCHSKVNFKERTFEPRDEVKGMVSRVYFYMYDRYDIKMSDSQTQLLMAWDKMYPVSAWERERDNRIAKIMGYHNPFVIGEKQWTLNHKNSGIGRKNTTIDQEPARNKIIIGNKNSKTYHLPIGCPSYSSIKKSNQIYFVSEMDAKKQGYKKAKNCKG